MPRTTVKNTAESKQFTTVELSRSNRELAEKLKPEGYKLKYWLNEYLREKMRADLFIKGEE